VLGLDALELDGDLFTRDDVGAEVDVAEGAGTDLAADAVLVADPEIHGRHYEDRWCFASSISSVCGVE